MALDRSQIPPFENKDDGNSIVGLDNDAKYQIQQALFGTQQVTALKATTTGTTTGANALRTLIDSAATFVTDGVAVGDVIFNSTDASYAVVISVDSETQLTTCRPMWGTLNLWTIGDTYAVGAAPHQVVILTQQDGQNARGVYQRASDNLSWVNIATSEGGGGRAGDIKAVASATVPDGWLACDGAAVSRTTYQELFDAIGVAWGVGDGSTTFNVPNLKGKAVFGRDATQTEFDTLGETGGVKVHSHRWLKDEGGTGKTWDNLQNVITPNGSPGNDPSTNHLDRDGIPEDYYTENSSNLPPYAVANWIVKVSNEAAPAVSTDHNDLANKQGGTAAEYYHLTSSEYIGTGTGTFVRADSPNLTTPSLGTPSSGNLSACTADGTNAVGYLIIPQNSQSAAYTAVLADSGKHIYHPSADTTARTFTIPANASVAYPIGTALTFVNDTSAGVVTIAITSDTLVLAGTGTTGSRTLAANGVATAMKVTSTRWIISGTGLT